MVDVSINFLNYNTRDFLERALSSTIKNTHMVSYELIVVDNDSRDDSVGMVKAQFPHAVLIANPRNLGVAAARNKSLSISQGRYILVLDSDTEVTDGAVDLLYHFMEAHQDAGAAGCRIVFGDGSLQHSANRTFPSLWQFVLNNLVFYHTLRYALYRTALAKILMFRNAKDTSEVAWVGGMCMMLRAEALRAVGGLDEGYFIFYEESDLCLRLKEAGWKIYYYGQPVVTHHYGKGMGQFKGELYFELVKSTLHYCQKNLGGVATSAVRLSFFFGILLRSFLTIVGLLVVSRNKRAGLKVRLQTYWKSLTYLMWG